MKKRVSKRDEGLQGRFWSTQDNRKETGDGTGKKENDDRSQKSSHQNGQQLFRSIHTWSKGNQLKVKQGHYIFTGTELEAFLGLASAGSALTRRPAAGRTATLPHPLSGENECIPPTAAQEKVAEDRSQHKKKVNEGPCILLRFRCNLIYFFLRW
ncbi:hypothetical protein QOT17_003078 [Balamuthia mandrillaris]